MMRILELIFFIQALSNLECGPTYHMKEVVLYDFAKDWEEFFSGNTKPVFDHFKRQRNRDPELCSDETRKSPLNPKRGSTFSC